ncbi:tetratricopeptide repeat protein [Francisella sp. W12-1067]
MIRCYKFTNYKKAKLMKVKNLSKKQAQALYTIAGVIIVAIICITIFQFYSSGDNQKMLEASESYQKALITSENPDNPIDTKIASFESVVNIYPTTSFGIFASWNIAYIYITSTKLNPKKEISATDYKKAINALLKSANANPKDSLTDITKTRLAKLYIETNQSDKAIETLNSLKYLQNSAYPLMLLGQAYKQKGNTTKAIEIWQKATQDPNATPEFKQIITQFINNSN